MRTVVPCVACDAGAAPVGRRGVDEGANGASLPAFRVGLSPTPPRVGAIITQHAPLQFDRMLISSLKRGVAQAVCPDNCAHELARTILLRRFEAATRMDGQEPIARRHNPWIPQELMGSPSPGGGVLSARTSTTSSHQVCSEDAVIGDEQGAEVRTAGRRGTAREPRLDLDPSAQ